MADGAEEAAFLCELLLQTQFWVTFTERALQDWQEFMQGAGPLPALPLASKDIHRQLHKHPFLSHTSNCMLQLLCDCS